MQCPNCKVEMEKGGIDRGFWTRWGYGYGKMISGLVKAIQRGLFVTAWRCPQCGKVELTTEVKEEK